MKKRIWLVIALMVVVSIFLVSCGNEQSVKTSTAPETTNTTPETTSAEKTYNMTFIMPLRNEFNTAMESGMLSAASDLNVSLTSQDVQNDSSKIIQFVETAKNSGDDAVIILPVDSETIPQIVEAAGDMKVIIVNRAAVDMSVFKKDVAFVGSNENDAGNFQGEFLAKFLTEAGETTAKPIILLGTLGAENTTKRTESAKAALTNAGLSVEVVAELDANWDRADAMTKIEPLLRTTDYNCVIANNDAMAMGAIEAMNSAGVSPQDFPVVGIDATIDGLEAVEAGTLAMTVFQDAAGQGIGSIIAAINLIKGEESIAQGTDFIVDSENANVVWIPFVPVYTENVSDFK